MFIVFLIIICTISFVSSVIYHSNLPQEEKDRRAKEAQEKRKAAAVNTVIATAAFSREIMKGSSRKR